MKRLVLAVLIPIVLSGCTSVLSNRTLQEADEKIPFADLQREPGRYRGTVVIAGGQIVEAVVKEAETRVQVLQLPLGPQHAPDMTAASQGRFIVIYNRFVDPLIYEKGRKITVAGEVQGGVDLPLNGRMHTFPVLLERETHLWKPDDYPSAYGPGPAFRFGIGIGR